MVPRVGLEADSDVSSTRTLSVDGANLNRAGLIEGALRSGGKDQCFNSPLGIEKSNVGSAANTIYEALQLDLVRISIRDPDQLG